MDGGRAAPLLAVNTPKKTGARSARARTRGQNPLVIIYNAIHIDSRSPGFAIFFKRIQRRIQTCSMFSSKSNNFVKAHQVPLV